MGRWEFGGVAALYVLVVVMAVMVVANRHHARQLFVEYQQLEKERDVLNASWSRLTLERSTRLNQVYVERRAKRELGMNKPSSDNIRIIRE
ncbi:MAG: Cell division protein FtsL [uncultured Thiotrichaceae bacterium]|uniref:Cell division protein FtsL n=1 Tax=uncultured Thiotrichaceae bacterium TaxID=298394 RepID=A0A6S6SVS4_9GAMM|nr:MAG: Cell division protein FtsL [uncultured Thiotrichaceae bacterium]